MFVKGTLIKTVFDGTVKFASEGNDVVSRVLDTTLLIPGHLYRVTFDGREYELAAKKVNNDDVCLYFDGIEIRDCYAEDDMRVTISNSSDIAAKALKIQSVEYNAPKINLDYLPDATPYEETKQESIEGLEFLVNAGTKAAGLKLEIGQSWRVYAHHYDSGSWEQAYDEVFPVEQAEDGTLYVGDPPNTSLPFYITEDLTWKHSNWASMQKIDDIKLVGVSGSRTIVNIKKLDAKYLPFFEFDVTMNSAGQYALTNLAQLQEAIDNNMTIKIVYTQTASGNTGSFVATLPCIRDCMVISNLSGLVVGTQYDRLSPDPSQCVYLRTGLNADDYANGKITATSVGLYTPTNYTLVKCYACPF